jgi:hypothetical protein
MSLPLCSKLTDQSVAKALLYRLWCSSFVTKDFLAITNELDNFKTINGLQTCSTIPVEHPLKRWQQDPEGPQSNQHMLHRRPHG